MNFYMLISSVDTFPGFLFYSSSLPVDGFGRSKNTKINIALLLPHQTTELAFIFPALVVLFDLESHCNIHHLRRQGHYPCAKPNIYEMMTFSAALSTT
jgi:hypothetical protein